MNIIIVTKSSFTKYGENFCCVHTTVHVDKGTKIHCPHIHVGDSLA